MTCTVGLVPGFSYLYSVSMALGKVSEREMSFISFIAVMFTLVFELDCTFLATWPLLTSIISLFYNYLSIDIEEQVISLV